MMSTGSSTAAVANTGALPFNKMFIMLPVMLAARNLQNDDVNTVFLIRVAYVVVQTICISLVLYTYLMISSITSSSTSSTSPTLNRIIYVPAPAQVSMSLPT
jgi:phosphotransferase system  glucose/maltose/N-acetylglucosamine-specific IIC component